MNSSAETTRVLVGTSGWSYSDWVGPFYPEGTPPRDYLAYYATQFEVVEVDSTYYAIPAPRTVSGWYANTPEGFLLAPKVPGTVTHGAGARGSGGAAVDLERAARDPDKDLERFLEVVGGLHAKLGPVLFQFPYFRVREMQVEDFRARLALLLERARKALPDGRLAVEIRNKSWISREYLAVLERFGVAPVMIDHPYMPPPAAQLELGLTSRDFTYIRFLGDRYAIERKTTTWERVVEDKSRRLDHWAEVIERIVEARQSQNVFVFSNNHFAGHAPATCRDFLDRLGDRIR